MKLIITCVISLFSFHSFADVAVNINAGLNVRECRGVCHFPTKSQSIQIILKESSISNTYSGDYIFEVPEMNNLRFVASLFVVKSIVNQKVSYRVEGHLTTFKSTNTDYTFKYFGSVVVEDLSKINLKWYTDIHDGDKDYAVIIAIDPGSAQ